MTRLSPAERRPVLAWAFYDWANSAFATVVIAGFFPLFFQEYWSSGADHTVTSFRLGMANSLASLVVLVVAPALGAIADQGGYKKRLLGVFAALGVVATAALVLAGKGQWHLAVLFYVLAGLGFAAGNIFYDALLVDVARPEHYDRVSGLGYALGYLGGGVLFALCVSLTLWPQAFGLADASAAVLASFLLTALWWGVFSLPLLRVVRERVPAAPRAPGEAVRAGRRKLRALKGVLLFLAAYWLYIDAVDTIIRMAVDYGMALGFDSRDLIAALLITQFVGFPAAIAFGRLGERIGARRGILLGLAVYVGITLWAYRLEAEWEFYGIAVAIGLVQGGVQSLSRSFFARLIPAGQAGEFFGFYNLLGKFAAVLGPALMGWVALATGDTRSSVLSLLVLFLLGAFLLSLVDQRAAERPA
jgi:UMF1 family MFS transporter